METLIGQYCVLLLNRWQAATPLDYGAVCTLIIVSGWITSRMTSR